MFLLALFLACSRPPDVVFLTVDTLRVDHVSAFSEAAPRPTPHIDALAADGVRFTSAWSPIGVTGPAFCSVLTGRTPTQHGVVQNVFRGGGALAQGVPTLAEKLDRAGLKTGAFLSAHTVRKALGLDRGFDTYDAPLLKRSGAETVSRTRAWLRRQRQGIFLWFHTFDAHGPYEVEGGVSQFARWRRGEQEGTPLPPYQYIDDIVDPGFYSARYASGVAAADEQVGAMVRLLKETRRYDAALIVLLADHGESLTERELWFDHGTTPSVEQLHVPLIFKLPGNARAGEVVDRAVSLVDVAPTVLAHLGLDGLEGGSGVDILRGGGHDLITGESSHCKKHPSLTCAPRGPQGKLLSARSSTHTLLRTSLFAEDYVLYDRVADPVEAEPLGVAPPPSLKRAVDALAAERLAMNLTPPEPEEADSEDLEMLRALGYLDVVSGEALPGPKPAPVLAPDGLAPENPDSDGISGGR